MKRNKIFIINKLSQYEIDLLKKDFLDHYVYLALKIQHLNFSKIEIEEVAKNSIETVFSSYDPNKGMSLGDYVKTQIMLDLRAAYDKRYPGSEDEVTWPDLASRLLPKQVVKPAQRGRLAFIRKITIFSKKAIQSILTELVTKLNNRQSKLLSIILISDEPYSHTALAKKVHAQRATVTNDIRVIHTALTKILQN